MMSTTETTARSTTTTTTMTRYKNDSNNDGGAIRVFIQEAKDILTQEMTYIHKEHNQKQQQRPLVSLSDARMTCTNVVSTYASTDCSTCTQQQCFGTKSTKLFRIMGRIIDIQYNKYSNYYENHNSVEYKNNNEYTSGSIFVLPDNKNTLVKCILTIDDGTATISVIVTSTVLHNNTATASATATATATTPHSDNCNNDDHYFSHSNDHGDKMSFSKGECIECIGILQRTETFTTSIQNNNNNYIDTTSKPLYVTKKGNKDISKGISSLVVTSLSKIRDPNIESLRMIELSCCSSTRNVFLQSILSSSSSSSHNYSNYHGNHIMNGNCFIHYQLVTTASHSISSSSRSNNIWMELKNCQRNKDDGIDNPNEKENHHHDHYHHIFMYGNLISNYTPFHRVTTNNSKSIPPQSQASSSLSSSQEKLRSSHKLIIDRNQILQYIELSKPNGITFNDLLLLFNCHTSEEIQALKDGLDIMHSDLEIYMIGDDSYASI